MIQKSVSLIIPTLNETSQIDDLLNNVHQIGPSEVIFSDGGSSDGTMHRLIDQTSANQNRGIDMRCIQGEPGRGGQLARAAELASGEVLLFMHADNRLPADVIPQMKAAGWPPWGAFHQHIEDPRWRYRVVEKGNAFRAWFTGRLFGDQAMFIDASLYREAGGFRDMVLMEDVDIASRVVKILKRRLADSGTSTTKRKQDTSNQSWRPVLLNGPLSVSPRRWHGRGLVKQTLLNWRIQLAYARGATPEDCKTLYER